MLDSLFTNYLFRWTPTNINSACYFLIHKHPSLVSPAQTLNFFTSTVEISSAFHQLIVSLKTCSWGPQYHHPQWLFRETWMIWVRTYNFSLGWSIFKLSGIELTKANGSKLRVLCTMFYVQLKLSFVLMANKLYKLWKPFRFCPSSVEFGLIYVHYKV